MNFKELLQFIEDQDQKLQKINTKSTQNERVLARMVKLSEEVGELADEVLSSRGDQRADKLIGRNEAALGAEVADVIITVFILAKSLDVDVEAALDAKVAKLKERSYEQGR